MIIENKEMESISGISTQKVEAEEKKHEKIEVEVKKEEKIDAKGEKLYVVLQPISSEKMYTCLQFKIVPQEIFLSKKERALKRDSMK